jgi:hypothetical protein
MKYVFFVFVLLLITCTSDDEFRPSVHIPESIHPYVDNFIHEAALRGHTIEITNLIVEFSDAMSAQICARCNSNSLDDEVQKIISIRLDPCYSNEFELETLVFHELGHCILGRLHTSETLPNGDPKSIMVANDIGLYGPCVYQIGNGDCDKRYRRSYYLDELFDATTPVPAWGN